MQSKPKRQKKMLKFNIITLFPDLFTQHLNTLPLKRAIEKGLIQVNLVNLRDFAIDARGTVDDKPFGGGVGMVLMIEPIYKALESIHGADFANTKPARIVVTTPRGKTYNQKYARELSETQEITIICGRYEGIDARVEENLATDAISIGNYVLSGGELPALVIMESVTRLLAGVLEKEEAVTIESFTQGDDQIEFPQYTRPEDFKGHKVPEILLSGNHAKIGKWRENKQTKD